MSDDRILTKEHLRFVHCDPRVLHAPSTCQTCDKYGGYQQELRKQWNMNFTGETDPTKTPCPADAARGNAHAQWGGNVAKKPRCKHCKSVEMSHDPETRKCLFEASFFSPMTLEEEHDHEKGEMLKLADEVKAERK